MVNYILCRVTERLPLRKESIEYFEIMRDEIEGPIKGKGLHSLAENWREKSTQKPEWEIVQGRDALTSIAAAGSVLMAHGIIVTRHPVSGEQTSELLGLYSSILR